MPIACPVKLKAARRRENIPQNWITLTTFPDIAQFPVPVGKWKKSGILNLARVHCLVEKRKEKKEERKKKEKKKKTRKDAAWFR